ncbi:MAG TPA: hypothetical protein VLA31_10915 [Burkholderiaceae bacterium]|nr:hypothetical protein [Burkholderiaceae bacterium]
MSRELIDFLLPDALDIAAACLDKMTAPIVLDDNELYLDAVEPHDLATILRAVRDRL